MILAGLKAFVNVENIESLTSECAATGIRQSMMELVMYFLRLDYLTSLAASDPEEKSARSALAKHVVEQVSSLSVSPAAVFEQAKDFISGYLTRMQEMVTQFSPTLNLPLLDTLLAQGACKATDGPAAVADEDAPEVLKMEI